MKRKVVDPTNEQMRLLRMGELTHEEVFGDEDISRELARFSPDRNNDEARDFFVAKSEKFAPVEIKDGVFLFSDGSKLNLDSAGFGYPVERPGNRYKRRQLLFKYRECRYEIAQEKFAEYRDACLGVGKRGITNCDLPDNQLKKLKRLKTTATKWRERMRKAGERMKLAEPKWMENHRRIEAEMRQERATHKRRISELKL